MATKQTTTRTPDIAVTFVRQNAECGIDERPNYMQLTFADGSSELVGRADIGLDAVSMDDRESTILYACAWHGAKQKLVDAAAISRDTATGKPATIEHKRAAVMEVLTRMRAGQWFKPRGEGAGTGGLLFRALLVFFGDKKTPEEVRAWLDAQSKEAQAQLRLNPRIATIIEGLRPAADATIDTDALLDQFGE